MAEGASTALPSGEPASSRTTEPEVPTTVRGRRPNPQLAQLKRTFYFLRRNTLAIVGLGILLFLIGVALFSFFYNAPSEQLQQYCAYLPGQSQTCTTIGSPGVCVYYIGTTPQSGCYPVQSATPSIIAPTVSFSPFQMGPLPLGSLTITPSNPYFFNLLDGLIKGAPWSLGIAAAVVGAGATIGLLLGATAGFFGGVVDDVIMRGVDIFLSIPGLLLLIVILATAGPEFSGLYGKIGILLFAFIITDWPIYTRIVRGQVLVTREMKYVEAAKASGAGAGRIIRKHIVPNSMYGMFIQMSLDVGTIPLALGTLAFLGFTLWPATYFPEWGTVTALSVNIGSIESTLTYCASGAACVFPWWQVFLPGMTLFLFAISVNFLSDGLRDALDPRLRR
jgi:peptide/nickel transport system permease protein